VTILAIAAALLLAADPAPAAPAKPKPTAAKAPVKAPPKGGAAKHGGAHGNPADLKAYAASLLDPKRDEWQRPAEVVKALGLSAGQVVCDVGAGPGYFTLPLAAAVGPAGLVYAVDVEPALLAILRDRLGQGTARNVIPVLSLPDDPLLPPAACDVVLVVDTFHHFKDGVAFLWRLGASLKPGGRIVNVDFHKRETPVGPPMAARISREDFLATAKSAGLAVLGEQDFLPHQYLVVVGPAGAAR